MAYCPLYARSVCDTTAPLHLQFPLVALYKCYAFTFFYLWYVDWLVYDTCNIQVVCGELDTNVKDDLATLKQKMIGYHHNNLHVNISRLSDAVDVLERSVRELSER